MLQLQINHISGVWLFLTAPCRPTVTSYFIKLVGCV